jgi:hypothetical protein
MASCLASARTRSSGPQTLPLGLEPAKAHCQALPRTRFCLAGSAVRREPHGNWVSQVFTAARSPRAKGRAAARLTHPQTGMKLIMTQTKSPHSDGPVSDAPAQRRPGPVVTAVGILMALWCLGFAAVNVTFEITGHFAGGAYGHYASGISVVDWLAAGLKVLGAVVALLSVAQRPRLASSDLVTVLVWAAFTTLGVYVLGAVAEAVGMGLGLIGGASQIDTRSVAYVLFFLVAAAGYGVLATSYSRRHPQRKGLVILGVLGAPVVLGLLLLAIPALLAAFGLLPGP